MIELKNLIFAIVRRTLLYSSCLHCALLQRNDTEGLQMDIDRFHPSVNEVWATAKAKATRGWRSWSDEWNM